MGPYILFPIYSLISKAILGMKNRRREIRGEKKKRRKTYNVKETDVSTTPIRMVALIQIFLDWVYGDKAQGPCLTASPVRMVLSLLTCQQPEQLPGSQATC